MAWMFPCDHLVRWRYSLRRLDRPCWLIAVRVSWTLRQPASISRSPISWSSVRVCRHGPSSVATSSRARSRLHWPLPPMPAVPQPVRPIWYSPPNTPNSTSWNQVRGFPRL